MNEDKKKLWIDALRSGEYKQTKSALRNKHGFCCLGVITDLFILENRETWLKVFDKDETCSFQGNSLILVRSILNWLELENSPLLKTEEVERVIGRKILAVQTSRTNINLSCLNDSGCTFEEIAKVIEELL